MIKRILGVLLLAGGLGACASADYPGFVDAAVETTTGRDLEAERTGQPHAETNHAQEAEPNQASEIATARRAMAEEAGTDDRSLARVLNFYSDWAAVVVSADYRANTGATTMAFDNARRDFSNHLISIGFDPGHISQLSMRPGTDDSGALPATMSNIQDELRRQTRAAEGGCLVYLTSHGSPEGISLGATGLISPAQVDGMLDDHCGNAPTVLIVSACYSGVFASPGMAQDNRFIMTAARSDRTSFGCGESDQYPYFDACVIENFGGAEDWLHLAQMTRGCVEDMENAIGARPPSSPQIVVGTFMRNVVVTPFIAVAYGPQGSGS